MEDFVLEMTHDEFVEYMKWWSEEPDHDFSGHRPIKVGDRVLAAGTMACTQCGQEVEVTDSSVTWSRINGDSRWGYEPSHRRCVINDEINWYKDEYRLQRMAVQEAWNRLVQAAVQRTADRALLSSAYAAEVSYETSILARINELEAKQRGQQ